MLRPKSRVKKFFENIEKKSEEEKMRLIWFLTIFSMIGIFCVWLMGAISNFSNLGNDKMDFSGLPKFPETENVDLGGTLQEGQKILDNYASENKEGWEKIGDKYIKDNNILSSEGFSSLKLADVKEENGKALLTYEHYYKDIIVLGSDLVLAVNPENQEVSEKQNTLQKGIKLGVNPTITAQEASEIASKEIKNKNSVFKEAELVIAPYDGDFYLAWRTHFQPETGGEEEQILVGAERGGIIPAVSQKENQTSNITK